MELLLPVSIGEGLDKLTILELKLKYIIDNNKKTEIKLEYDNIYPILEKYKNSYDFLYKSLLNINDKIWELCDNTRDKNNINYSENCEKIIIENDARFRIKNKINTLSKSLLKEQKSYNSTKALLLSHMSLGDSLNMVPIVRYLTLYYDEVYLTATEKNYANNIEFYSDDPSIKIIKFINDWWMNPNAYSHLDLKKYNKIFVGGIHNIIIYNKGHLPANDLPFNFYNDMNLPESIFYNYFYVPPKLSSELLYNKLAKSGIYNYIFMHGQTQNGIVFCYKIIEKYKNISKNNILIIDPNINQYKPDEQFYELAQQFIGHKILDYTDTIINASEIYLSNSSFFCLTLQLPVKAVKGYVEPRGHNLTKLLKKLPQFEILVL